MAWQDQQDQEKLRQNGLGKLFGGWDDFWSSINRPVNYQAPSAQAVSEVRGPTDSRNQLSDLYERNLGPVGTTRQTNPMGLGGNSSKSMQVIRQSSDGPKMPGLNINQDMTYKGNESLVGNVTDEDRLRALLGREFNPTGENDAMIEQAYAGALAQIGQARGQANSNFQQSDSRIAGLTEGHVNSIKTDDRAAVSENADNLKNAYSQNYGAAKETLQADQSAEFQAKAEALSRLGISEAGMGAAGQTQSDAITRLTADEAGAQSQADTYKAADLTRNTEQAQSQASAGVERRSQLNNQLQKILGSLGESESTVNNSLAMAKLQGAQQEKSDWRQEQQFNLDSLNQIQSQTQDKANADRDYALKERELLSKQSGSGGMFSAVGNDLMTRGIDPTPYLEAYTTATGGKDVYNSVGDGNRTDWIRRKMLEANPRLTPAEALRYVMGIENYGTDKLQ